MAEEYEGSGGSDLIEGASRSLEDVTAAELMALQVSPARPSWMVTRYPVDMEEFERLNRLANEPEPLGLAPGEPEAIHDQETIVAETAEVPEDGFAPDQLAPTQLANFEGIPQTAFRPPDCTIAAGPNHVLLAVNSDLAGYTKAGVQVFRWAGMVNLFNPVLPANSALFDPRLAYDHYANRWIVVAVARRDTPRGSWIMLGVSQTANPAGAYWVWALDATRNGSTPTNNWADYPMLGFDTQGIYIVSNMFQFGGGFQYCKLRILNKAEVYAGGIGPSHTIRWFDFWGMRNPDSSIAFTMQPAVHFRGLGGNPPAYLVNALWPGGTSLTLWTLTNPIGFWTGGAAALARNAIACLRYDLPPDAQQRGTATPIETNDARLLNAIYQNVSNTQRLWTCQTTRFTWPGESVARSALQFYEIDVINKSVVQQNRFGAPGAYYYYPAIQTDISRRAFVVFGRSNANEFAQVRQTGRRVGDPPNTLQGSALVQAGRASYTGGRWGDYFGICRDPANTRNIWVYGEYANLGNTWGTRVAATTLPAPLAPEEARALPMAELESLRQSIVAAVEQAVHSGVSKT